MSERIYIITAIGWNPNKAGGAGLDTVYYATKGFTSSPADTPANTYFEPRISNPGMFQQSMYSVGATGGNSDGGKGFVELINTDGGLDVLVDWGFDGNLYLVQEGPDDGTLADFATVISGTIEQANHEWSKLILTFRDNTTLLDKPVALHYYAGNNSLPSGLEGVNDLKGKAKPRLFGSCFNIEPVLVNTSKLTYQYNDGSSTSIGAVRDSGVALTLGTSHANSTALQAATVTAGYYDRCLSEGYIRLGSSPVGQVTMDAVASTSSIGQYFKSLAVEKLGSAGIVEQSIIDVDKAIPSSVVWGYYTGTSGNIDESGQTSGTTTKSVFDELAKVGVWWGFDNNGKFWAKQFAAPESNTNPIIQLDGTNVLSITREATTDTDKGVPVWKVTCRYNHNFTTQTTLAGSVAVGAYKEEWFSAVYVDPNDGTATGIRTKHPLAVELVVETPFKNYSDALAEATRQFNLRSIRRDRLRVTLPMKIDGPLSYPDGGYWDDEAISEMATSRYYHQAVVFGNYVYVIGGVGTTSVIRLDLTNPTGAWDDAGVTDLPTPRYYNSAVIFGNYVYVIGSSGSTSVIRLDLTNPTGAWDDAGVTDLPAARNQHTSVVFGNYVYVIGGGNLNTVIRLDLTNPTGAWDDAGVTDLPFATYNYLNSATSVVFGNYVYVFGGTCPGVPYLSIRLDLTNPTGAWDDAGVTDLPFSIYDTSSVIFGNYVYVIGGNIPGTLPKVIRLDLTNPTGAWDDAGVTDLPEYRQALAAIVYNNSIYIFGGYTTAVKSNTWRWRQNALPSDRSQLASLGRTSKLTMPRYGYGTGRNMKIIGAESNHQTREITLELWG